MVKKLFYNRLKKFINIHNLKTKDSCLLAYYLMHFVAYWRVALIMYIGSLLPGLGLISSHEGGSNEPE